MSAFHTSQRPDRCHRAVVGYGKAETVFADCDIERSESPSGFGVELRAMLDQIFDDAVGAAGCSPVQRGFAFRIRLVDIHSLIHTDLERFQSFRLGSFGVLIAVTYTG